MATTRSKNYFANKKNNPIQNRQEVQQSNDPKIDQDFPGFPYGQSKENLIKPETHTDAATADLDNMDGEKQSSHLIHTDAQDSDGSASAFTSTEAVKE